MVVITGNLISKLLYSTCFAFFFVAKGGVTHIASKSVPDYTSEYFIIQSFTITTKTIIIVLKFYEKKV